MTVKIKRVYEESTSSDGKRILVERLWPRGIKKEALKIDLWLKNVAPSTELRKWFSHDVNKWNEFQTKYKNELKSNSAEYQPIIEAGKKGNVTLLFSSRDTEHNNAVVLQSFIQEQLSKS
ncbi:MAG: DUF488 domain-containing protein [Leptonema sp. (in: Bacteria)]|nr:DUF488 domain-containing protein [Leptonema sp. (in: bacteria)]